MRCSLVIVIGMLVIPLAGSTGDRASEPTAPEVGFLPRWQVGQEWLVETESALTQSHRLEQPGQSAAQSRPLRWLFTVQEIEKFDGQDCLRVTVHCQIPGSDEPLCVLWFDRQALVLRKVQTRFRVQGGFRTLTESYHFEDGRIAPVLGPLPVLPLDMPLLGGTARNRRSFTYQAATGEERDRRREEVRFGFEVEQQIAAIEWEKVKQFLGAEARQEDGPLIEVRLQGTGGLPVRQIWQRGLPWPAYSDNGYSVSRLIRPSRGADK
jgi:hypothetical protein